MASLNRVILIGHLGRDAETKYVSGGKSVTSFSLATSFKSKGEELTDWHNIEAWDKEKISEYLTKGKQVAIEGRIRYESWEKDGEKKYKTKIIADVITLLGSKGDSAPSAPSAPATTVADDDVPF